MRSATNEKTRSKKQRGKLNGCFSQTPRQLPIVSEAQLLNNYRSKNPVRSKHAATSSWKKILVYQLTVATCRPAITSGNPKVGCHQPSCPPLVKNVSTGIEFVLAIDATETACPEFGYHLPARGWEVQAPN